METVDLGVCSGQLRRQDPERVAILLPGAFYVPAAPLLWFIREVLEAAEWTVLQVWDMRTDASDAEAWVSDRFEAARLAIGEPATTLIVAKSLTTLAAPRVAELGLPAVWLTPLLHQPTVREGLHAATTSSLLIGGSADPLWDGAFAATLPRSEVLEFEGADHALQLPGDPHASLSVLGDVCDAVAEFAAGIV